MKDVKELVKRVGPYITVFWMSFGISYALSRIKKVASEYKLLEKQMFRCHQIMEMDERLLQNPEQDNDALTQN